MRERITRQSRDCIYCREASANTRDFAMSLSERIQVSAAGLGIVGALLSGFIFMIHSRQNAIDEMRNNLALTWTNEGDISSGETDFIDLSLVLEHGDLFGTLSSPQTDDVFEVHVEPGWFSASATVSHLQGRNLVPIASVKLKLTGNKNRLEWMVESSSPPQFIPRQTLLWPSSFQNNNP